MIYIDDLIGIPYKNNGYNKHEGLCCWGLLVEAEKRLGRNLPDTSVLKNDVLFTDVLPLVRVNEPKEEGDIIVIKYDGFAYHVGYYLGDGYVLHCDSNGVNVIRLDSIKEKEIYTWQY